METTDSNNEEAWLQWDIGLHTTAEQTKRQTNAKNKDVTPISIFTDSGIFHGSKVDYTTTLLDCTCRDFMLRKKPCKHMYRLAFELGVYIMDDVHSDYSICTKKRIDDVMPIVFSLSKDLQILYRDICFSCGNDNKNSTGYVLDKGIAMVFVSNGLLCTVTDSAKLYSNCKMNDIRKTAKLLTDIKLPKTKKELINFMLSNYPTATPPLLDNLYCLELPNDIAHLAMKIRRKLYDKYPVEYETYDF